MTDVATRWGLPAGFQPVRYPLDEDVKEVMRDVLAPGEPVIVTLANESRTVSVIATPYRLFVARSGLAGAGVTGYNVKEFPWAGITNMVMQRASLNVKFVFSYKTSDGRTVEVGRRAKLGKDAKDNVMPFEPAAGAEVFETLQNLWRHYLETHPQEE
jgi:hypothetical protein